MESKIPLHKTGLVLFGARILSIFTGMIFLVMITGWLVPARFGFWEVLVSFVAFAAYPSGWLSFWATREVARGGFVARTAILLNLILSLGGLGVFFVIAAATSSLAGSNAWSVAFAAILVPLAYWNQASNAVAGGVRPAAMGYSILISELAKLAVAYPALFIFRLEVNGVILAVFASSAVQAIVTTALVRSAARDRLSFGLGRKWLSDSWIPATYSLAGTIATADTVVAWLASGAFLVTGYYQAAYQIGILVSYANYLSYALYPLLLRGESEDAANSAFDFILIFGIPMTFGVVALAPHLLAILSQAYSSAGSDVSSALDILALFALLSAVSAFFDSILTGTERADLAENRSFSAYRKSNFVFVSFTNLAYSSAYIVGVFLVVRFGLAAGWGLPTVVETWAIVQVLTILAAVLLKFRRIRAKIRVVLPKATALYLATSALMAFVLYTLSMYLVTPSPDRLEYGIRVMGLVVLGGLLYFGILFALDKRVRGFARSFFRLLRPSRTPQDEAPVTGTAEG